MHNGTHIIDAATWLLGEPPVVVYTRAMPTFAPAMTSPDSFHIQARTASGSLATLELRYALRRRCDVLRRVVLVGSEGTLRHSTEEEAGLVSDAARPAPVSVEGALHTQLAHWLDLVGGRSAPVVRTSEVRGVLAVALAAQQSLVRGVPVTVDEVASHDRPVPQGKDAS